MSQALRITLCGTASPSEGWGSALVIKLLFSCRVACASSTVVLSPVSTYRILVSTAFFQFYTVSFSPTWHSCCWYRILKNLVGLPCLTQGFTLYKRLPHRFFPDYSIFIFGLCCYSWRDLWVTYLLSPKSSFCDQILGPFQGTSKRLFSTKHTFLMVKLLITYLLQSRYARLNIVIKFWFLWLNSSSLNLPSFSHFLL